MMKSTPWDTKTIPTEMSVSDYFLIGSYVLLALGYVLRKKAKTKEEERQSTNCVEGTLTEEGSKWLKKKKGAK
jgi:hypothetical protein